MAWNAPGGNNKDPWKDSQPQGNEFEKRIGELLERFSKYTGGAGSTSMLLVVAIVFGLWLISGIYMVDEKERGVVLRFGKYYETVGSGLHWNPRFIDEINITNVTQVTPFSDKVTMLTVDENIVDVELSVQYRIAEPEKYWLKVKDPKNSLAQATEAALRHVVGTSKMDKVLTKGREEVAQETKMLLREYMKRYQTGIEVDRVNIEDAQPPQPVKAAFEDVVKAGEDKQSIINEAETYRNGLLPEARGEAHSLLEQAEGYKQRVIAEAQGDAQRFDALVVEYHRAPKVTRQRLYLETIEAVMSKTSKVFVDVKGGNNMLYLPLDKLLERPQSTNQSNQNNRDNGSKPTAAVESPPDPLAERSSREREGR